MERVQVKKKIQELTKFREVVGTQRRTAEGPATGATDKGRNKYVNRRAEPKEPKPRQEAEKKNQGNRKS